MRPKYRPVNQALGKYPRIGPFPAELLPPLLISASICYFGYAFFGIDLAQAFFFGSFLLATWWLTTGGNSFRFISRFSRWFRPRWLRSAKPYTQWTTNHEKTIQTPKRQRTR